MDNRATMAFLLRHNVPCRLRGGRVYASDTFTHGAHSDTIELDVTGYSELELKIWLRLKGGLNFE